MKRQKKKKKVLVPEAVARSCSVKRAFLETSKNSQEAPVPEPLFLIKLQASGKISKKFVNFAKFLRRAFPTEHLRWLLL